VILIFFILRAVDGFMYFSSYSANKQQILAVIIDANLWSITLLAGIWFRHAWARYTLATLLLLWLGLGFIFAGYVEEFFADKYVLIMGVASAGYIAAAVVLMASPSLHKLTSRSFG
jgi:hypothetical protein